MKKAAFTLAALIITASTVHAAPKYNPRDPNTNDRKAVSCHYASQASREENSRLVRPMTGGHEEAATIRDSGKFTR